MENKRIKLSTADDYSFFTIGNVEKCKPCRLVHERLTRFVKINPEFTFSGWNFNWDTRSLDSVAAEKWLDAEKKDDSFLRSWKTIPMVWINGKFIGGREELFEILDSVE